MLNTKYFIVPTEEGIAAQQNPETNGNAWFVRNVELVESADEAILALGEVNTKETAVLDKRFEEYLPPQGFEFDANATIELVSYKPNELVYEYSAEGDQLAVFSEMYYAEGWQAYLDGEEIPHFRANYLLRAMVLPGGEHSITFKFVPEVIKTGSSIALASSILLALVILGGLFLAYRKRQDAEEKV